MQGTISGTLYMPLYIHSLHLCVLIFEFLTLFEYEPKSRLFKDFPSLHTTTIFVLSVCV